jgi:hypothetical protein
MLLLHLSLTQVAETSACSGACTGLQGQGEMEPQTMEASSLPLVLGFASVVVVSVGVVALLYRRAAVSGIDRHASLKAATALATARNLKAAQQRPNSLELASDPRPRVRILYGTQTGTAERFSKQLAREFGHRFGEGTLRVDVTDLENFHEPGVRLPKEQLVVMCVATYGDGEPTDSSADFFAWLTVLQAPVLRPPAGRCR